MVTRRSLLTAGVTTGLGLAAAGAATGMSARGAGPAALAAMEKFRVPMPVSPVLQPLDTTDEADVYAITMKRVQREIVPGMPTDVLTYDGHFPGPTIRARTGRSVVIRQRNSLDVATSVHLHGASVQESSDGSPMDTIEPGGSRLYVYPNRQSHAPLWYHDHAHHSESENVYRGLSGSYLLTDDEEESLPLPSGQYEVVMAIRDAHLDDAGQLVYSMGDRSRNTMLTNGVPYPYFEVAARKYRLRLVNTANMRSVQLRLADGGEMVQIGSDGGLLPAPHPTDSVFLSAGERADVVIDFSRYPVGTRIVLENTTGYGPVEEIGQILRFDVVRTAHDRSEVPSTLRTLPPLPQPTATRSVELRMDEDGIGQPQAWVDGKVYDPERVDSQIRHGASEVWTVTNANNIVGHNFHMHLVQFRVLDRNGQPPAPGESGLKDTVYLAPQDTVRVQATFDTFRGTYVYHCHMLDHSAMGMMATMKID